MRPNLRYSDIKAGARIAGVDPLELRRRLMAPPDSSLPAHLANSNAWVDAATDLILSFPMEFNAELLACRIYDRLIKLPPDRR